MITSWSGSRDIDHDVFVARRVSDATVAGAGSAKAVQADRPPADYTDRQTVWLPDSARITFATAIQFGTVETL